MSSSGEDCSREDYDALVCDLARLLGSGSLCSCLWLWVQRAFVGRSGDAGGAQRDEHTVGDADPRRARGACSRSHGAEHGDPRELE